MQFSTALIALFAALTVALPTHVSRQAAVGQIVEAIESHTGDVTMAGTSIKRGELMDTVDGEVNPLEDKVPEDDVTKEVTGADGQVESQVTGADGQVESEVSNVESYTGKLPTSPLGA